MECLLIASEDFFINKADGANELEKLSRNIFSEGKKTFVV